MGGTKCLRLGTCELEYMGGVLQKNSSINTVRRSEPVRTCHAGGRARKLLNLEKKHRWEKPTRTACSR